MWTASAGVLPQQTVRGFDEDGGCVHRVQAFEALDDHVAGLKLVVAHDFFHCHVGGAGDGVVEIVGVGSADVGEVDAGL